VRSVRLERGDPILSDVVICTKTGWTPEELDRMPERFVEICTIYLNALEKKQRSDLEAAAARINMGGGLP